MRKAGFGVIGGFRVVLGFGVEGVFEVHCDAFGIWGRRWVLDS